MLAELQLTSFRFRAQTWVCLRPQSVACKAMWHDSVQWDLKSAGAAISVLAVLLFDLQTCCSAISGCRISDDVGPVGSGGIIGISMKLWFAWVMLRSRADDQKDRHMVA